MDVLIKEVNNLLAYLEPEFTQKNVKIKISNCQIGSDHTHLFPNSLTPQPDLPNIKEVTLETLVHLQPVDLRDHTPVYDINSILDSMVDQELAIAIGELKSLRDLQPLDNDIEKINSTLTDIAKLVDLAYEYVDFENDTFTALNDCHNYQSKGKYEDKLSQEAKRVVDDLNSVRELTLGSLQAISLLSLEAERLLQTDLPQSEVLVLAGSVEMRTRDNEPDDYKLLQPLWLAFNKSEGLYQQELVVMPKWAALTLGKIMPNSISSSLYPKSVMDTKEFQVAKVLHKDGGLYANFDEAINAAGSL